VASAQIIYEASVACSPGNKSCADGNSSDGIFAYKVDSATGEVSSVPGSPFNTGSHTQAVAASPSGNLVFAADFALQVGDNPVGMQGTNDIVEFRPDPVTGALTKLTPNVQFGAAPSDLVVHKSGRFLYALASGVFGFTIDENSGALTPINGMPVINQDPLSMTLDPTGDFIYMYSFIDNNIFAFRINQTTGALTPVLGSPFSIQAPQFPSLEAISVHPSGKYLYVSALLNTETTAVFGMAIDPNTGVLTSLPDSPYLNGSDVTILTFARDGASVYAPVQTSVDIASVNSSTGTITLTDNISSQPFGGSQIMTDLTGQFVYIGSNGLMGYRVQGDGGLQQLPGFPVSNPAVPVGIHAVIIAPLP
jgi:6-phosphogluconolactonase (cycloisomerase 2 family)